MHALSPIQSTETSPGLVTSTAGRVRVASHGAVGRRSLFEAKALKGSGSHGLPDMVCEPLSVSSRALG
jgi:hypothetical protein